jgi:tetratricopeptide (TPR) repeat protein
MKVLLQEPQRRTNPGRGDKAYPLGSIKLSCITLGGVLVCLLCFGGCSESVSSVPDMDLAEAKMENELRQQADRPPTAKTLCAMADILAKQGRDSECEFVLKRVINDYPKLLPPYNSLAELQMRQRRISAAIETLQAGLRIDSGDPVLLNNLGMCWIVRGDYEKALKMFRTAAGLMPENARYRANMAVALGLMGRDEESLSLLRQVLPKGQAEHNLNVLREARNNLRPAPESPPATGDLQEATKDQQRQSERPYSQG